MSADAQLPASDVTPRRRRRWPWVLAAVVVLLLIVGFVAELALRSAAQGVVSSRVTDALDLPEGTPVEVDFGGVSLVLQALTGSIDTVDIRVDDLALGQLTGDLEVHAEGVPLDSAQPTEVLAVRYTIPEAALDAVAGQLSGLPVDDVTLDGTEIVASGNVEYLGVTVPFGLGLVPSAVDGALAFTPESVRIGDQHIDVSDLTNNPVWRSIAGELLDQQQVCIADRLPAALTLESVRIAGSAVVLEFDASGQALGGEGFQERGVCAS